MIYYCPANPNLTKGPGTKGQRARGQRAKGPKGLGAKGPMDKRAKGPKGQGPKGRDQRAKGPKGQGPKGHPSICWRYFKNMLPKRSCEYDSTSFDCVLRVPLDQSIRECKVFLLDQSIRC